ncbi:hypothetical protein [Bacillus sp. V5-8f]|uniref:hypothetical protein n=1 Tax=Bacillus sp. V5-8f TaxID=2053044 RepID=UPI000C75E9DC|nr:hypothetical protein [Bacillus sp. V5-8f]PLT34323.1 hypothetical protein CUU64_08820 [Bacillus sp. V5-8f]
MKWLVHLIWLVLILTACGNNIPEPQINQDKQGVQSRSHSASAKSISPRGGRGFQAKYFLKGNSLYVECFLKEFTFSPSDEKESVKVRLYLDGKKLADYRTAAFVVKKMPRGRHDILMQIVKVNGEPVGLEKRFTVQIDSGI